MAILHVTRQVLNRRGQFAHKNHQILLYGQNIVPHEIKFRSRPGQSEGGIEFVHGPVSFHARLTFGHPPIIHQAGGTIVAGFSDDAHAMLQVWI